jgi:Taurine catabolism dioxygenase TauD, TfdA family
VAHLESFSLVHPSKTGKKDLFIFIRYCGDRFSLGLHDCNFITMIRSFISSCALSREASPTFAALRADWKTQSRHSVKRRWLSSSLPQSDDNDDDDLSFVYSLPWQFLRSADCANFDKSTHQRIDVPYESATGKPVLSSSRSVPLSKQRSLSIEGYAVMDDNKCSLLWSDGRKSLYDLPWLERQFHHWKMSQREDRIMWKGMTEESVRKSSHLSMSFQELISEDGSGMSRALKALYQYGIVLVTKTPLDDDGLGVSVLGAALSGGSVKDRRSTSILANFRAGGKEIVLPSGTDGPLRTLYGRVWSTSSANQADGTSIADSAYTNDALPLHTDSSYHREPPGLQIFTMVQPALVGGQSVFCDGFSIAEVLRTKNPAAFEILSRTTRRYFSQDKVTGWHLEASGPVIEVKHGRIVGIRHNDLDRLPDMPPNDIIEPREIDEFYDDLHSAHAAWDALLAQDKFRLVVNLNPGDTMVVANQVGSLVFLLSLRCWTDFVQLRRAENDLTALFITLFLTNCHRTEVLARQMQFPIV